MRWLLDENVPGVVARQLIVLGQDVATVVVLAPGAADDEVLSIAREERRILVSFDRDFGDLIFGRGEPAPPAVVYLRIAPPDSTQMSALARMLAAMDPDVLAGHFTVVTANGLRQRVLPPQR